MNSDTAIRTIKMTQSVSEEIRKTVGTLKAETGGLGFGLKQEMIVRHFVFDPRPGTRGSYTLNSTFFNPVIQQLWEEDGIEPLMIVHSHPAGFPQPSIQDIAIGKKYLQRFELNDLHFPIVVSCYDHKEYQILPYSFSTSNEGKTFIQLSSIEVIPDQWVTPLPALSVDSIVKESEDFSLQQVQELALQNPQIDFSRVEQAVSISVMKKSHVVVVGTGGAASFCKQIARLGIGKLTLIDPDLCGLENIPRQSFTLHDALSNQPKVHAVAEEIKKINPDVEVVPLQTDFTELSDEFLDDLMKDVDIILMLTDSFKCQAFGNKVVLKYKKMGVWAGYYTRSRAAELFFYISDLTPGCFRCAVSSRYEAQSKKRIKSSTAANTIFHSDLLDAYVGFIVLALLHNNIEGYEFSNWFKSGFKHNLIQFKTSPLYNGIFNEVHGNNPGFFNFGAVWQEVLKESQENGYKHNCLDCIAEKDNNKRVRRKFKLTTKLPKLFSVFKNFSHKKYFSKASK